MLQCMSLKLVLRVFTARRHYVWNRGQSGLGADIPRSAQMTPNATWTALKLLPCTVGLQPHFAGRKSLL